MVLLFLAACAHHAAPPTGDDAPLPFDPGVQTGVLPNGLTWYVEPCSYPKARAELRLAVKTGSLREDADQWGGAHVLEHMAFQGSAHFQPNELVGYMESVGMKFGADTNASTTADRTVYTLRVPTDDLAVVERGLTWFADIATSLTLAPDRFEHERSVVLEEWRRRRGVGARVGDLVRPFLFPSSPYGSHDTIGTEASIQGLQVDAVRRYWSTWYRPDAMAVIVAGDVDPTQVEAMVTRTFGGVPKASGTLPELPGAPKQSGVRVLQVVDPEISHTALAFARIEERPFHNTYRGAAEDLAGGLVDLILSERFAEAALAPDAPFLGAGTNQERLNARLVTDGLLVGAKAGREKEALEALLVGRETFLRFGPTAAELHRAADRIRAALDAAQKSAGQEDPSARVAELVRAFVTGESVPGVDNEVAYTSRMLSEMTPEKVSAAAKERLGGDTWAVVETAPAGTVLPSEAEVRALLADIAARPMTPPAAEEAPPPLLTTQPTPGTVVATRTLPELGATEWTLSNGARVVVRPSAVRPDEVLFRAWSPGGTMGLPPADVVPASTADSVAEASGLGELDPVALAHALAGQRAHVGAFVGGNAEGLSGAAPPTEVETMLQLAWLQMTSPRFTQAGFDLVRAQRTENLRKRLSDPDAVAADRLTALLWGDAPWHRPWTEADLAHMDLARSRELYTARFANAGDFVFAIGGNVDLTTLRPLVERYLASLPGKAGTPEAYGDDGLRPARGVHDLVRVGLEPKASVTLLFTGPFAWSPAERTLFGGLADLLDKELRDALREEQAGTYDVSAHVSMDAHPTPTMSLTVRFTCAPERRAALTERVLTVLHAAATTPATDTQVAEVRAARMRAYETNLETNSWWMDVLENVYVNGDPMDAAQTYPARVAAITPASLRSIAEKYLDFAGMVELDRVPADTK